MRLSSKIAYNTIVQVISKVIATALGLVAMALMTRYLGQVGFGQYITIITYLSFFAIVADLGLTLVTVQMISQPNIDQNKMLSNLLGLRLITAIIFLGLAPIAVLFFPYPAIIKIGVLITTLSFLCIALNQVLVGLFQKHLRMDKVAIAEVSGRIILVLGIIFIIKINKGLLGIMTVSVVASIINFILHYLFSRSFSRIRLSYDFAVWKTIFSKSWPLAVTIALNLIYLKTDTLLLSIIKRPSNIGIIAEVGIYGAAYRVIDVLVTFPFMFAGIVLPVLTAVWARKDYQKFKEVIQKSFNFLVIVAIPIVVGTQFIAKDIMTIVAGSEFSSSGPILKILIGAAGLIFFGNIFAHAVIAIDKQKKLIGAYGFTAVTAVIGYLIFIPRYSYFGAAWVTIYSELVIAIAPIYIVWKYSRFLPNFTIVIKSLAAAGVMAGALYFINDLNLVLIVLPTAILAYFLSLYLFGGITKKEIVETLSYK